MSCYSPVHGFVLMGHSEKRSNHDWDAYEWKIVFKCPVAALGTPGEMLFQAFYCTQSLPRSAMRGENACLPGSQLASLIAIPMVMAKDEGDQ